MEFVGQHCECDCLLCDLGVRGALPLYIGMPGGTIEDLGAVVEGAVYRALYRELGWTPALPAVLRCLLCLLPHQR